MVAIVTGTNSRRSSLTGILDLAKQIVNQKTSTFEPEKFEDHYEAALTELINQKRSGRPITTKPLPKGENVVDLMDALKRSIANDCGPESSKGKKPRRAVAGQRKCCCLSAISALPRLRQRKRNLRRREPESEHDVGLKQVARQRRYSGSVRVLLALVRAGPQSENPIR